MSLHDEIFQQADVTRDLFTNQWDHIQKIAQEIKEKDFKYIFLAARGTSDNAGLYAKYLFGAHNHIPIALAAPSLFSIYNSPPNLDGALVLAISQSGQSPDIVNVIKEGKRQDVPTLTIANKIESPLAQSADYVIDIMAGEEKSIAATKSYTAELMAVAMLSAALSENPEHYHALQQAPDYIEQTYDLEDKIIRAVEQYYYMKQCVVVGRGMNYATAFEWALKMKEMTYVVAESYSSADFLHGPIAMVEEGFPVFLIAPSGAVYPQLLDLAQDLKQDHNANLLILSDRDEILGYSNTSLKLPEGMPEWISPLVSIVPAQIFCYYLTKFRGLDPENPRGLKKVTKTT